MKVIFKMKMKGKYEIYNLGPELYLDWRIQKALESWKFPNLVVETGRELIGDFMVNDLTKYNPNAYTRWLAVGTDSTPPTLDDWKLNSEQQRAQVAGVDMERTTGTSICQFTALIPSGGGTYNIFEAGLFLSGTAPTSNPQTTPSQRPNSMISRGVEDSAIPKNDADNLRITYTLEV